MKNVKHILTTTVAASLLATAFLFFSSFALAQENSLEASNESIFSRNQKFDNEGVELYDTNLDMKNYKKLGFGVSAGGLSGLIGLNLEVNIQPENAITFGLGTGPAYNSFNIGWKQNYESQYLSPYTKLGYSSWFNANSSSSKASESDILKRVLTNKQIEDNRFQTHFMAAGFGLEYNQLEGELSGVNFFGELLILGELASSVYLPTAGVGLIYFY